MNYLFSILKFKQGDRCMKKFFYVLFFVISIFTFASDENDKLMAEVTSPKTLTDPNYKPEAYKPESL